VDSFAGTLESNGDFLIEVTLKAGDLAASCDVLTKVSSPSSLGSHSYEPTIVVGTHGVTREQKLELLLVGYVLGQVQHKLPVGGTIVGMEGQAHRMKLESNYKMLRPIVDTLREWIATPSPEPPPVILNRHCPSCPFRDECKAQAEKDDDLSLLDRMTPKLLQRYHKKGIFTVNQLSYVFKPRRSKKRARKATATFNPELQALAIRTGKTYLHQLPELSRHRVELFLDIEGIPDQNLHYLIGLLVCDGEHTSYRSFWADTPQEEERVWNQFCEIINEYPDVPIYHYGQYEPRATEKLAERYQTQSEGYRKRLVNVSSYIYGKVYFPARSNNRLFVDLSG
jgi:predicted RecB family nuclease